MTVLKCCSSLVGLFVQHETLSRRQCTRSVALAGWSGCLLGCLLARPVTLTMVLCLRPRGSCFNFPFTYILFYVIPLFFLCSASLCGFLRSVQRVQHRLDRGASRSQLNGQPICTICTMPYRNSFIPFTIDAVFTDKDVLCCTRLGQLHARGCPIERECSAEPRALLKRMQCSLGMVVRRKTGVVRLTVAVMSLSYLISSQPCVTCLLLSVRGIDSCAFPTRYVVHFCFAALCHDTTHHMNHRLSFAVTCFPFRFWVRDR